MSYRRFFFIRLAQALFALWLVATLVFVMFFVLLPKPEREAQDLVVLQAVVLYGAFLGIAATFVVDSIVGVLDADVRGEWRFAARPRRVSREQALK